MKLLTVIAVAFAALVAAQKGNIRGVDPEGKKTATKYSKGKKNYGKYNKKRWTTPKKEECNPNKKGKCSQSELPHELQNIYETEFKAIDTNVDGCIDTAEFKTKGTEISTQISDTLKQRFQHYRESAKGKYSKKSGKDGSSSWANRFKKKKTDVTKAADVNGRRLGGSHKSKGGSKGGNGSSFWQKYLESKGFGHKKEQTQAQKDAARDKMDSYRAARVFRRFDEDRNGQMTECEYAAAMYKMKTYEDKMKKYQKQKSETVVVHG